MLKIHTMITVVEDKGVIQDLFFLKIDIDIISNKILNFIGTPACSIRQGIPVIVAILAGSCRIRDEFSDTTNVLLSINFSESEPQ